MDPLMIKYLLMKIHDTRYRAKVGTAVHKRTTCAIDKSDKNVNRVEKWRNS